MKKLLLLGQEKGEISPDIDATAAAMMFLGMVQPLAILGQINKKMLDGCPGKLATIPTFHSLVTWAVRNSRRSDETKNIGKKVSFMFVSIIQFPKIKEGQDQAFQEWLKWSNSEFSKSWGLSAGVFWSLKKEEHMLLSWKWKGKRTFGDHALQPDPRGSRKSNWAV